MKNNKKKGFTLMELLIVIAIIVVLVAIAIPVFGGQLTKAKQTTDLANIRSVYAEEQTAILSDNKAVTGDTNSVQADFTAIKNGSSGAKTTLNYKDNLTVTAGTGTLTVTYACNKLTPATQSWTFKSADIQ